MSSGSAQKPGRSASDGDCETDSIAHRNDHLGRVRGKIDRGLRPSDEAAQSGACCGRAAQRRSRKRGFSKTSLTAALAAAGIGYRHETELGNPPENRDAFRLEPESIQAGRGVCCGARGQIEFARPTRAVYLCECAHNQPIRSRCVAIRSGVDHYR